MKRQNIIRRNILMCVTLLFFTGCSTKEVTTGGGQESLTKAEEISTVPKEILEQEIPEQEVVDKKTEEMPKETEIIEIDLSEYFQGLNGAAVFYSPYQNQYKIYNLELATTRRSPCSTFKIVSSLIGLENGIISKENSVRKWSGEQFWKEEWNQDIDFEQAFKTSCVWYFREVINEIGPEIMQASIEDLQYGNCDSSDWTGRLNTNNQNPALTGFWIESSLKISAKEQTEVMKRIFEDGCYQKGTIDELKKVMEIKDQGELKNPIYGKTGMGKAGGITVDSWFTGFTEKEEGKVFFSIYLGETKGAEVSSAKAKEIAITILENEDYVITENEDYVWTLLKYMLY